MAGMKRLSQVDQERALQDLAALDEKLIKVVVITEEEATVKQIRANSIDDIYAELGCDCFDIARRNINGKGGRFRPKYFDIYCDDNGLMYDNPRISAIDNLGNVQLVGNLLVSKHNEEGEAIGLTDAEAKYILGRVVKMSTRLRPVPYPILTCVEY